MKNDRPLDDDQLVEIVRARMARQPPPEFCPVCGGEAVLLEEHHPYGEGTVTEFLGVECSHCGRLFRCATCDRWVVERWYNGGDPPEEHRQYMCQCAAEDQVNVACGQTPRIA